MKLDRFAQTTEDIYWIDQYRSGNQEGMRVLYQRYFQKVYRKCLSFCKDPDDAFDLAQDILLKAFEHLYSFKGESSFSTWLYTLTYNHYREVFRKSKRMVVSHLSDNYEGEQDNMAETFGESSATDQNESKLLALLNTIPETDKALLLLKYYEGQSIEQIQKRCTLSASAVKMRLKRAKTKLNWLYTKEIA